YLLHTFLLLIYYFAEVSSLRVPLSTPSSTLFPYTTLFRSSARTFSFASRIGVPISTSSSALWIDLPIRASGITSGSLIFSMYLRSEEHTSELQSRENLVCRLLLEKKQRTKINT